MGVQHNQCFQAYVLLSCCKVVEKCNNYKLNMTSQQRRMKMLPPNVTTKKLKTREELTAAAAATAAVCFMTQPNISQVANDHILGEAHALSALPLATPLLRRQIEP